MNREQVSTLNSAKSTSFSLNNWHIDWFICIISALWWLMDTWTYMFMYVQCTCNLLVIICVILEELSVWLLTATTQFVQLFHQACGAVYKGEMSYVITFMAKIILAWRVSNTICTSVKQALHNSGDVHVIMFNTLSSGLDSTKWCEREVTKGCIQSQRGTKNIDWLQVLYTFKFQCTFYTTNWFKVMAYLCGITFTIIEKKNPHNYYVFFSNQINVHNLMYM